jgi:hypothetical protein
LFYDVSASISQRGIDVGAVYRRMTARTPTAALGKLRIVLKVSDNYCTRTCRLSMAFQAQILVPLCKQLIIDGAMGIVAY